MLHCRESPCPAVLAATLPPPSSDHSSTELLLFIALCMSLAALAYTNRRPIEKQMKPFADAISRKVHYTNLSKQEDQEMNVWSEDLGMCLVCTVKPLELKNPPLSFRQFTVSSWQKQILKTYLMYSKTLLIQINWGSKLSGLVKVWINLSTVL